jgi:hypothetical protein
MSRSAPASRISRSEEFVSFTFSTVEAIMKTTLAMIVVLAASVLCLPALAAAQGTVALDQLSSRLQIGDKVKVIDTEGREAKGELLALQTSSITVDTGVPTTFEAHRIRAIQKDAKSIRKPLLYGMLAGAGVGAVLGGASGAGQSDEGLFAVPAVGGAALGVGIGAGAGAIIGAFLPSKWQDVYRAPGASGSARVSIAPMITTRAKGVVLSFSF